MEEREMRLMKGNEAIAEAAIRGIPYHSADGGNGVFDGDRCHRPHRHGRTPGRE